MTEGTEYEEQPAPEEAVAEQPPAEAAVPAVPAVEQAETESAEEPELEPTPSEPAADDVAAAIAEAGENLEAAPTFDDIAPGTVAREPGCEDLGAVEVAENANSVSIWPFAIYEALWLIFAGVLIWRLQPIPADRAVFESSVYPLVVVAGTVLTIAGPLLILAVWIATWGRPGSTKGGLFFSALMKGAVATLVGVVLWWAALIILDQLRLGRLL